MVNSWFFPPVLPRQHQVRRLCRLARLLRQRLRQLPWPELSAAEKRRLDAALDPLEKDVGLSRGVTATAGSERRPGA